MFMIGDGTWRGGINYQRTLLETIAGPLGERIEARVFVTESQRQIAEEAFGEWLEEAPVVDSRAQGAGIGRRALGALLTGRDSPAQALLEGHGVDVVFETARFFGRRFPIPGLAWMPDFQHRHLRHLFSRAGWWKRELGFRAQAGGKRIVLLSSETARADCERFYPNARGRIQVARFAPQVDLGRVMSRAQGAVAEHRLPERFFYMPNQVWAHKNHALAIAALRRLRESGALATMPPVVMSGSTTDHRSAGLFERLMGEAEAEGLSPWFRHLGLIPFADVLALNAAATAVLNPSRFEGWASSVEEAKALGTPLILSDIPVHREQAPEAAFFGTDDSQGLAEALRAAAASPSRAEPDLAALERANTRRQADFAQAFEAAILAAHALR